MSIPAVVHNGIIENDRELLANGYSPQTETDTEVVAPLATREMANGASARQAEQTTLGVLRGSYALLFLFKNSARKLIAARRGSTGPAIWQNR